MGWTNVNCIGQQSRGIFPIMSLHGLLPLTLIYHGFCGKKNHLSYPRALWTGLAGHHGKFQHSMVWQKILRDCSFINLWFTLISFLFAGKCLEMFGRHPPWRTCGNIPWPSGFQPEIHKPPMEESMGPTDNTDTMILHDIWISQVLDSKWSLLFPGFCFQVSQFHLTLQGHTEKV